MVCSLTSLCLFFFFCKPTIFLINWNLVPNFDYNQTKYHIQFVPSFCFVLQTDYCFRKPNLMSSFDYNQTELNARFWFSPIKWKGIFTDLVWEEYVKMGSNSILKFGFQNSIPNIKSGGDDFCKINYNQVSFRIFDDLVMVLKKIPQNQDNKEKYHVINSSWIGTETWIYASTNCANKLFNVKISQTAIHKNFKIEIIQVTCAFLLEQL